MTPINCSYIYNIGQAIERLGAIKAGSSFNDIAQPLLKAYGALQEIHSQRVYALPLSKAQARNVLNVMDHLWEKYQSNEDDQLGQDEVGQLFQARTNFETVLKAEWDKEAVFAVSVKRGFDSNALVWDGLRLFPLKLATFVPEAVTDLEAATRCIAFELPTAAAFHLCRGFEAVVRKLFEAKCGQLPSRPGDRTLGALLVKLESHNLEPKLLASLRDLKDLHRNPYMHPEHTLEDVDEAISLLNAMDAPIGHMLRVISDSTEPGEHAQA